MQTKEQADAQAAHDARDGVYRQYMDRIEDLLRSIGVECSEHGMEVQDVVNMSVDEYRWSMVIGPGHQKGSIDIVFELGEAISYGDEPDDGVSFSLALNRWGGECLMVIQPWLWTENCWVSAADPVAIQRRWFETSTQISASKMTIIDKLLAASECRSCGESGPACTRGAQCCSECEHQADIAKKRR